MTVITGDSDAALAGLQDGATVLIGGFGTAGQRCTSLGTAIVADEVHDAFVARLAAGRLGAEVVAELDEELGAALAGGLDAGEAGLGGRRLGGRRLDLLDLVDLLGRVGGRDRVG